MNFSYPFVRAVCVETALTQIRKLNVISTLYSFIWIKFEECADRTQYYEEGRKEGRKKGRKGTNRNNTILASWKTVKVIKRETLVTKNWREDCNNPFFVMVESDRSFQCGTSVAYTEFSRAHSIQLNYHSEHFTAYQGPIKLTLSALDKCLLLMTPTALRLFPLQIVLTVSRLFFKTGELNKRALCRTNLPICLTTTLFPFILSFKLLPLFSHLHVIFCLPIHPLRFGSVPIEIL
jgi:hypothetical protein